MQHTLKRYIKKFYLDIGGRHRIRQIHDKFGKLFHIDDILGILRVRIDDLGTAGHLPIMINHVKCWTESGTGMIQSFLPSREMGFILPAFF
jgi:hypothetical protein